MSCEPETQKILQLNNEQKQELTTLIGEFLVKHFPEGLTPSLVIEVNFHLAPIEERLLDSEAIAFDGLSASSMTSGCVIGSPPNYPLLCGLNKRLEHM
jgi:hypothetical protein